MLHNFQDNFNKTVTQLHEYINHEQLLVKTMSLHLNNIEKVNLREELEKDEMSFQISHGPPRMIPKNIKMGQELFFGSLLVPAGTALATCCTAAFHSLSASPGGRNLRNSSSRLTK